MKKITVALLLVIVLIVVTLLMNFMPVSTTIEDNETILLSDYLITETPEVRDYNGHTKNDHQNYNENEDKVIGEPWPYTVNALGMNHDDKDNEDFRTNIFKIQSELASNEYYCMIDNDKQHLILPWRMQFEGVEVEEIAKKFNLNQIKIRGYKLIEINGNYEYQKDEITFEEGKTQTLQLDTSRFYQKGIVFENDDGHRITIMADKHSKTSCHIFYHEEVSEYQLLKTDHLDWWIFERETGSSFVSFQGNSNSQYDLFIHEGMYAETMRDGILEKTFSPVWGDDYLAFKEVLDQVGDLSQLDTKLVGWTSSQVNNEAPVTTLREMK